MSCLFVLWCIEHEGTLAVSAPTEALLEVCRNSDPCEICPETVMKKSFVVSTKMFCSFLERILFSIVPLMHLLSQRMKESNFSIMYANSLIRTRYHWCVEACFLFLSAN
mmetsp:Transcript_70195/g.110900  ORF Transcript_70195/g.110900 Transcript_70195/m.110900 type:complete len:109 (+) Transcript_70195:43-369(+)